MEDFQHLEAKARWLRATVFDMAIRAHSGHISTAYSQTEILVALYYGGVLRFKPGEPRWQGRDRFILSKGQGGLGLYPILADVGFFPMREVETFTGENSLLGVHADWHIPGIEVITGSLGHGLPIAVGKAAALRAQKRDELVVCLVGDAELYEGSNWEAAISAAHFELDNLVCIVDRNGQGVLGKTDEIESFRDGPRLNPLDAKFTAFGFETRTLDGHSFPALLAEFRGMRDRIGKTRRPLALIANTKKGKGLSLMEDQRMWHYRVPAGADLERCRADLEQL